MRLRNIRQVVKWIGLVSTHTQTLLLHTQAITQQLILEHMRHVCNDWRFVSKILVSEARRWFRISCYKEPSSGRSHRQKKPLPFPSSARSRRQFKVEVWKVPELQHRGPVVRAARIKGEERWIRRHLQTQVFHWSQTQSGCKDVHRAKLWLAPSIEYLPPTSATCCI